MRPIKLNADYFSHDSNASIDEKIIFMESRHGYLGYAFYFKMLEILTRNNNFRVELTDLKIEIYSKIINVPVELYNRLVEDSVSIGLFQREGCILFSPGLIKRLEPLVFRREKKRFTNDSNGLSEKTSEKEKADLLLIEQEDFLRVKESKVKESKVNTAYELWTSETRNLIKNELFLKTWNEFKEHRKQIKHKLTDMSEKKLLTKLAGFEVSVAIKMINESIIQGWQGIFELKSNNYKNNKVAEVFTVKVRKCSSCNQNLTDGGVCYTSECANYAQRVSSVPVGLANLININRESN